jgi:hypothetical protein
MPFRLYPRFSVSVELFETYCQWRHVIMILSLIGLMYD